MRLHNKKIPYQYFIENIKIKRKLFTSGKVIYTGEFSYEEDYIATVTYTIYEPEDVSYFDNFARTQLTQRLLAQINKGK